MMIFTKEGNSRSEPPSALNGWNTVIYKQDIARASELEVVEPPGSGTSGVTSSCATATGGCR